MRIVSLILLAVLSSPVYADEITLVKHARRTDPAGSVPYTVKPHDTLATILMDVYGARAEDMPYLYKKFRELNPAVTDLNYIKSDQKLIIPRLPQVKPSAQKDLAVQAVEQDYYVIKQGEHLAQVLRRVYHLSDDQIFHGYIEVLKELNPDLKNPNHVLPGQKIRLARKEGAPAADTQVKTPETGLPGTGTGQPQAARAAQPQPAAPAAGPAPRPSPPAPPAVPENVTRLIRNTLFPALQQMGGRPKDQGTYFMPIVGGGNIAIDAQEIPVMELDTGARIILDSNNKISPELKQLIEKAFPACKVVTKPGPDLESLMDRVLSVSGYFSINKNASPLLVGEEEKLKLSGKWIVYKDFSRHNVFILNILNPQEGRTPPPIRAYASRFGLDIVELGGREVPVGGPQAPLTNLRHSFPALFDRLGVAYTTDKEIELLTMNHLVRITYKAPLLAGSLVLAPELPDATMQELLQKKGYVLRRMQDASVAEVLRALKIEMQGPPYKITVAAGRTELDLPGIQVGKTIILEKALDRDIINYVTSTGKDVLLW